MSRPVIHPDEIVGFAVLLLMAVALVAGQADASGREAGRIYAVEPIAIVEGRVDVNMDSEIGAAVLKIGFDVVTDLSHIRGEDE